MTAYPSVTQEQDASTWTVIRIRNVLTGTVRTVFLPMPPPDSLCRVMNAFADACPDWDEVSGKEVYCSMFPAVDPILPVHLHVSKEQEAAIVTLLMDARNSQDEGTFNE